MGGRYRCTPGPKAHNHLPRVQVERIFSSTCQYASLSIVITPISFRYRCTTLRPQGGKAANIEAEAEAAETDDAEPGL